MPAPAGRGDGQLLVTASLTAAQQEALEAALKGPEAAVAQLGRVLEALPQTGTGRIPPPPRPPPLAMAIPTPVRRGGTPSIRSSRLPPCQHQQPPPALAVPPPGKL